MATKCPFILVILLPFLSFVTLTSSFLFLPSSSTLHPKQLKALKALHICISPTSLVYLSTFQGLSSVNCPIQCIKFPSDLSANLKFLRSITSFTKMTLIWLSKLHNLTDPTVSELDINCHNQSIIHVNMKNTGSVRITQMNLTEFPTKWHLNVSWIDLSGTKLEGEIPPNSLTHLSALTFLNLSSNRLSGVIPTSFGDLLLLRHVSFASNSISGPIPESVSAIPSLVHLDLSSNKFNGTVPKFLSEMRNLRFLNLEKNNFQGVLPFNESFIETLDVFKVGGNSNLCYNQSAVSSKLKLGIGPCDQRTFPMKKTSSEPAPARLQAPAPSPQGDRKDHGPNKVVLVVAIGLSSLILVIVFLVILSKMLE